MITLLTLIPLLGGLVLIGMDREKARLARQVALFTSTAALLLTGVMWMEFDPASRELQQVERFSWIPQLGVEYFVGIDGLGLLMLLLTTLLVPFAIFSASTITDRVPVYLGLMLFLEAGLIGTFTALNFFHWFLFWELSLIPAFFLVRLWGGPGRAGAATQFFVYTMVGSVAMLLSFLAIFLATGTFDFIRLSEMARSGELASAMSVRLGWYSLTSEQLGFVIFGGVFLGFAVKVPVVPFHTWLPAAYSQAPTSTTILLTGVMSKMGVYGFLRILLPIFPSQMQSIQTPLLWLAIISILYPAFAAFVEKDLKKLLGYSSINHLGYCLLGIFAAVRFGGLNAPDDLQRTAALNGVMLQMFNHGLTAAALFGFVAFLEKRSGGLRNIEEFGGLRKAAPVLCGLMGIAMFASIGLPGLNGFVSEFLIFKGAFALAGWAAALSAFGLLLTAIFLLTMQQKMFHGPLHSRWGGFQDLTFWERVQVAPFIALIFFFGVFPQPLVNITQGAVEQMIRGFSAL